MVWHLLSAPHQWQEKLLLLQVKQSVKEAQESAWTLRGWRERRKKRKERRPTKEKVGLVFLLLGFGLVLVFVLVGVGAVAAMLVDSSEGRMMRVPALKTRRGNCLALGQEREQKSRQARRQVTVGRKRASSSV